VKAIKNNAIWINAAFALLLVLLSYLYLYPGSAAMVEGRTDIMMSDDTDPAPLPYAYDQILQIWKNHPSRLFYGAVYNEGTNPEQGIAYWMPWSERWFIVFGSIFFPVEQLATFLVFMVLILNGLSMFWLARKLKWHWGLSAAVGIAWAFNPFTRARAKVHMAMAGTYHLPLIFLGLLLVQRGKTWRSVCAAGLAFLVAVTTVHYFIVTSLFLAPFFLLFLALSPDIKVQWKRLAGRLAMALLPAVLFLGWNFLMPVPSDARMARSESFPRGGETRDGSTHPFLNFYSARVIDYFSSDMSLSANDPVDINPLRKLVSEQIIADITKNPALGNAHERTNGIRWLVWVAAIGSLVVLFRRPSRIESEKRWVYFFVGFGLFGLWLSLSPDIPFQDTGASYWMNKTVSQVRVPSRAGIIFHFSLLMLAGTFVSSLTGRWGKLLSKGFVLPALMVVDYPPVIDPMPMASIRPAYSALQRSAGGCGAGMYFPFLNPYENLGVHYAFIQRMRGSDCVILNEMTDPKHFQGLSRWFPPTLNYLDQLPTDTQSSYRLQQLAKCVPLTWLAFDPAVNAAWATDTCQKLGWKMNADGTCVSGDKGQAMQKFPDECPIY
jgi:hypothetical protein